MIRMKHPEHGFHHAYNKLEEDTMRKNGWVDDVPAEAPAEAPVEIADEQPAPRRPGRPRKD